MMKTYEEMSRDALKRIRDYETGRKKRKKALLKIILPVTALCVCAVICAGIVKLSSAVGDISAESSTAAELTSQSTEENSEINTQGENTVTDGTKGEDPEHSGSACIRQWKNKLSVSGQLYKELTENPEGKISVKASFRPATSEITDFIFEGEALCAIAVKATDEKALTDKMYELLKMGDYLKYGEKLYETGTPSGEKWDKRLYEDKVAFYGRELLDKYIVNGEFLKEKLEKDIAEREKESPAARRYKRAYAAYMETVITERIKTVTESGIGCKHTDYTNNSLTIYVTANELEGLPLSDPGDWYFDLDTDESHKASENFGFSAGSQRSEPGGGGLPGE